MLSKGGYVLELSLSPLGPQHPPSHLPCLLIRGEFLRIPTASRSHSSPNTREGVVGGESTHLEGTGRPKDNQGREAWPTPTGGEEVRVGTSERTDGEAGRSISRRGGGEGWK